MSSIKWSSETNLLTHKAEDGLAEADDPEDELEDEEDEEGAEALGDEELKEGFSHLFFGGHLIVRLPTDLEDAEGEDDLTNPPRGGAFAEE